MSEPQAAPWLDALVDGRTGLVGQLSEGPGPWPLPAVVARFRAAVHTPWSRRPLSALGAALGDPQAARVACVAEAAERYCAAAAAGTGPWSSTGCAAGRSVAAATTAACWELLERHQLATAWYGDGPLPPLPPPRHWSDLLAGEQVAMRVRRLPGDVPAALVVLHATEQGLLGAGTAARSTTAAAVDKASCEAVVALAGAAELADPDSPVLAEAVAAGLLRPWRSDRRYLDSYRADLSDVTDLACHAQLLLDPSLQRRVLDRLDRSAGGGRAVRCGVDDHADPADPPPDAHQVLASAGTLVVTDLTTPEVAATGLAVVRASAEGLRDLVPAAEAPAADPVPLT